MKDEAFYNQVGGERIQSRQVDELIGICRGLAADGAINQLEAEFLQKWLAANLHISENPVIHIVYQRVSDALADGRLDSEEAVDLLSTLNQLSVGDFELGEMLKPTSLPLCNPAPDLLFDNRSYCFTGTFSFGKRGQCEQAVVDRGGRAGSLTQKTNVLVIGAYATESWKHSSFGNKIIYATELRDAGFPITIVSETHWATHL